MNHLATLLLAAASTALALALLFTLIMRRMARDSWSDTIILMAQAIGHTSPTDPTARLIAQRLHQATEGTDVRAWRRAPVEVGGLDALIMLWSQLTGDDNRARLACAPCPSFTWDHGVWKWDQARPLQVR